MSKPKLVVLTGAGMSAESGISTFRDSNGLWENHRVEDVASPGGWKRNQQLVLDFYNQRRKQVLECKPNKGHFILAGLEHDFDVSIITQNIDNLHECAGSSRVIHLHGEITKVRSTLDPSLVYDLDGWELKTGDKCERGSQLRPHIVWFGEEVPMMSTAVMITERADFLIVVGTSLLVYPAAGLAGISGPHIPKFIVDPNTPDISLLGNITPVRKGASEGLEEVRKILLENLIRR